MASAMGQLSWVPSATSLAALRNSGSGLSGRRRPRRRQYAHFRFDRRSLLKFQLCFFTVVAALTMLPQTPLGPALLESTVLPMRRMLQEENSTEACTAIAAPTNSSGEFPPNPFSQTQMEHGAILVHIFVIFYMFTGLAIVCDEYFEPALGAICENLHLKEDVAGATFMAAGGSAPELFSSIIGVFVAKSDIGFGTIVGSATFNVLFVIAACSFVTENLALSWWPLTRDCVYYCFSILVLVLCIVDRAVSVGEAAVLLVLYGIYITIMYFNERLEVIMTRHVDASRAPRTGWRLRLGQWLNGRFVSYIIYAAIIANVAVILIEVVDKESPTTDALNEFFSVLFVSEMVLKIVALSFFGYWRDSWNAFDGTLVLLILVEVLLSATSFSGGLRGLRVFRFLRMARALRVVRIMQAFVVKRSDAETQTEHGDWEMLVRAGTLSREEVMLLQGGNARSRASFKGLKPGAVAPAPMEHDWLGASANADLGTDSSSTCGPAAAAGTLAADSGAQVHPMRRNSNRSNMSHVSDPATRAERSPSLGSVIANEAAELARASSSRPNALISNKALSGELRMPESLARGAWHGGGAGGSVGGGSAGGGSASIGGPAPDDEDEEDDEPAWPFARPEGGGVVATGLWLLALPLSGGMWLTIPDCRRPMFRRLYFATFAMCIVWIALLAYVMIWMATIFGDFAGIPDPVMGLTLLAAGTSVPDLLSSMAVARRGLGDMAVSSSIGSNIFDILIGLPVPWFIATAFVDPGSTVTIFSEGLTLMVLTLFLMVAAVVSLIHWSDWVMTKKMGLAMIGLYGAFMLLSLLLELGALGELC